MRRQAVGFLEASDERIEIARIVHCIGNHLERQFISELVLDVLNGFLHHRRVRVFPRPRARFQIRHAAQGSGSQRFRIHRPQRHSRERVFMNRSDDLHE